MTYDIWKHFCRPLLNIVKGKLKVHQMLFEKRGNWLFLSCPEKFRSCTHRGSQDYECMCVEVTGQLFSIELPPELYEHLRATQRLSAHLLAHMVSVCAYSYCYNYFPLAT